eukprot:738412_1
MKGKSAQESTSSKSSQSLSSAKRSSSVNSADMALEGMHVKVPKGLVVTQLFLTCKKEKKLTDQECIRIFKCYRKMDKKKRGYIEYKDLCKFLHLEQDTFLETLFAIMDEDENGTVEFDEFLNYMTKLLLAPYPQLVELTFRIYDQGTHASKSACCVML